MNFIFPNLAPSILMNVSKHILNHFLCLFQGKRQLLRTITSKKPGLAICVSLPNRFSLTLYILGYFYTLFVPGGKFAPLSKNRLVSDRIKIFWLLKLFFVKFLKTNFLRL